MSPSATSTRFLNPSRDGDSTTALVNITFTTLLQILLSDERPGPLGNVVGAVPGCQAHASISCEIQDPLVPKNLEGLDPGILIQNKAPALTAKSRRIPYFQPHKAFLHNSLGRLDPPDSAS